MILNKKMLKTEDEKQKYFVNLKLYYRIDRLARRNIKVVKVYQKKLFFSVHSPFLPDSHNFFQKYFYTMRYWYSLVWFSFTRSFLSAEHTGRPLEVAFKYKRRHQFSSTAAHCGHFSDLLHGALASIINAPQCSCEEIILLY